MVDAITYEDGLCECFQYNSMGKMSSHTFRSGKQVSYRYDIFGNIVEKQGISEDGSQSDNYYRYEYSKDGLLTTAIGGGITYHYAYDSSKRLAEKSACGRSLIRYTYDFNGNIKTVTDTTGKTTTYVYDLSDRLITIQDQEKELAHYTYTNGCKVAKITCGDIETSYQYDLDGNTISINISISEKTISYTRYLYDQSGNCITKEYALNELTLLPTAKTEYTYDGLNQLIQTSHINLGTNQSVDEFFTYDKAGNRIQRSILNAGEMQTDCYSYGLLNELNSITQKESNQSTDFSYDTDGNMRSDGRGIYCYDEYQQMTEARMEDGNKLVCRYDAEGLRYEMEENENLVQFIYSGRDVVYEESESASSVRTIRGNGRIIASDVEHARTYYHYVSDDLGSITHLICMNEESVKESTNVDSGRIVGCYDYNAFGNRIYEREEVSNRYGFTGEIYDKITGQYYLRARYYRPEFGRFTQPDSYHGDGLNLYVYVGNNPVRYVDPSGHAKCGKDNGVEGGNKGAGGTKAFQSNGRMSDDLLLNQRTNTKNENNLTEWRRKISKSDIKTERIKFVGEDAVKVDKGIWRSIDGTRQFRVVPADYFGRHPIGMPSVNDISHVHFEFLETPNPGGNKLRVVKNIHVPIVGRLGGI